MRFFLPWILAVLSLPTVLMADEIPSWLQDAMKKANAGDAIMQLAVARSYADGTGVDQDHSKALEWYRKAAEQGNANAEYAVAKYYINGKGVKADKREAEVWLRRATKNGHKGAEAMLIDILPVDLKVQKFVPGTSVKVVSIKVAGQEFKNATITTDSRLSARIEHDGGTTGIMTSNLPLQLQQDLGVFVKAPKDAHDTLIKGSDDPHSKAFKNACEEYIDSNSHKIKMVHVQQDLGDVILGTINSSDRLVAIIGDKKLRADDTSFSAVMTKTDKIYSYTTVLGAKKNIETWIADEPIITQADVVEVLKKGSEFVIDGPDANILCGVCEGRPIFCTSCFNNGFVKVPTSIKVKW